MTRNPAFLALGALLAMAWGTACRPPSSDGPRSSGGPGPSVPAATRPVVPPSDLDEVLARAKAQPGQPTGVPAAPGARPPEQLFRAVGCINCHGTGAAYHQRLVDARGKPEADIARWIRHPEQIKPTTAMPTFANLVTEPEAQALAHWIKAGNPP
jgi:mono/diheme cytochrome c family protein